MTKQTLKEMSHTHPVTDESFGQAMVYRRGPVIAADGGVTATETTDDRGRPEKEQVTLSDIEHTPPHEGHELNRVYERGREIRGDV